MSGYHYTREAGAEGQILAAEGAAPGLGLDVLLDRERPPLRAALEIGAAMADILCIAEEDKAIHGDIRPAHVRVDDKGNVSVEGYGITRRQTRAPEGRPDSPKADIFGLGVVLHSILSGEAMGALPKDADAHDEEVVDRVLAMDFTQVQGKRWLEDVRNFLCKILAYQTGERPAALDAANVLASVAVQCPGEGLEAWARRAIGGAGRSRAPAAPPPPPEPTRPAEVLGGPVSLSGPFARAQSRQAPAAKGESTAFWSRDKIAAMLAEEDDEPPPPPRRVPPPPVVEPAAVPFPSRVQEAPSPRMMEPPRPVEPPRAPEPVRAPPREDRMVEPVLPPAPPPRAAPPPPMSASPAYAPPQGPIVVPRERSVLDDDEPTPSGGGMKWAIVGVLVLIVGCGGFAALGGGAWLLTQKDAPDLPTDIEKPVSEEEPETPPAEDEGGDEAAPAGKPSAPAKPTAAPAPKPKPGTSASAASKPAASRPAASTPAASKPAPAPAAKPTASKPAAPSAPEPAAPASGPYTVRFNVPGQEGKIQCGDGQSVEFVGASTLNFEGTVTCRVRVGAAVGVVQVTRAASVTCNESGGRVSCAGG